jgi:hypothetical protein
LLRSKPFFEHSLLPRDHQYAGLLVTDTDFLEGYLRLRARRERSNCASNRQSEKLPTLHSNLLTIMRPTPRDNAMSG